MDGSVINRSVMNVVCFEWSVMSRSVLNGHRLNHPLHIVC